MFGFKANDNKKTREKKSRNGSSPRKVKEPSPRKSNESLRDARDNIEVKVESYSTSGDALKDKEMDLFILHALNTAEHSKSVYPHFIIKLGDYSIIRDIIRNISSDPDDFVVEDDADSDIMRFN